MHSLFYPAILLLPLVVVFAFVDVSFAGIIGSVVGAWFTTAGFVFSMFVYLPAQYKAAVDDVLHAVELENDAFKDLLASVGYPVQLRFNNLQCAPVATACILEHILPRTMISPTFVSEDLLVQTCSEEFYVQIRDMMKRRDHHDEHDDLKRAVEDAYRNVCIERGLDIESNIDSECFAFEAIEREKCVRDMSLLARKPARYLTRSKIAAYRNIVYDMIFKINHLLQMQSSVWIRLAKSISCWTSLQEKRALYKVSEVLQRIICSGCLSWIRFQDERIGPVELWNQMPMLTASRFHLFYDSSISIDLQNDSRAKRLPLLHKHLSSSDSDEEVRCENELREIYIHDIHEGRSQRRFARYALLNAISRGPPTDYEVTSPTIECSDLESMFLSVLNEVLRGAGAHQDSDEFQILVDTINTLRFDSDRDAEWLENAGQHLKWSRERENESLQKIYLPREISVPEEIYPADNERQDPFNV